MKITIENKKTNLIVFEKDIKDLDNITTYPESIEIQMTFEGVEATFTIDLKENKLKIS